MLEDSCGPQSGSLYRCWLYHSIVSPGLVAAHRGSLRHLAKEKQETVRSTTT